MLSQVLFEVRTFLFVTFTSTLIQSRVLDPILFDLHDPQIRRLRSNEEHNGRSIQAFRYEKSFDQRYTSHLLDNLLSIVKFGGQGFGKIARSTAINRTSHVALLERIQMGKCQCYLRGA